MSARRYRWPIVAGVLLLVGPALFVVSEAPLQRLIGHKGSDLWTIYWPFDRVTEWSPLLTPLVKWAKLWGVRDQYIGERARRSGGRYVTETWGDEEKDTWVVRE